MSISENKITNDVLLRMLGVLLVEIRSHSDPSYGIAMSDVFHNVPARLIRGVDPIDIYQDMERVAFRHNAQGYLNRLLVHSLENSATVNFDVEIR